MEIEFKCPNCSFAMFTMERQGDIRKLHGADGVPFKIINAKIRLGEVTCGKCNTVIQVDLAVLGFMIENDPSEIARLRSEIDPFARRGLLHLCGFVGQNMSISWIFKVPGMAYSRYHTGIINIHLHMAFPCPCPNENTAMTFACHALSEMCIDWLIPLGEHWLLKLDKLGKALPNLEPYLQRFVWARGELMIRPEYEFDDRPYTTIPHNFLLSFSSEDRDDKMIPPRQIEDSLLAFRKDHPDPMRTAFIVMKFGVTRAHKGIVDAIRSTLAEIGIQGVRADDKQYHADQFGNVLTYIWGCGFGVAVFERLSDQDINPNVSFEVGYMLALEKKVAFLKDETLRTLPTDLVGKLYKPFNPQRIKPTIKTRLKEWLKDHSLLPSS